MDGRSRKWSLLPPRGVLMAMLGTMAFVGACKQGPDFQPPETPSPVDYRGAAPAGESVANVPWWELYQDPALQSLIEAGLENNRGLREAAARIAESRASLGMVRADLYPSVSGIGAGFYQETGQADSASTFDNFKLAASAGYEVDLWGKIARSNEAAIQGLLATEEAYRTVTISLVADIAGAYLVLRDLDARLELAEGNVRALSESLEILEARVAGGLVPPVAVNQARVELADGEAVIQKLIRARAKTENALSLLVGRLPGEVARGASLSELVFPPEVPAGLPSELLQRRPDVLGAERALHAQTALIGVAEAARFPSLSLTGSFGVKSTSLGEIVSNNSFLNLGANIVGPLFTAGRSKARVEVERAKTEQLLNQYEMVVLNAFREVEDALVAVETYRLEHEARLRQFEAAREGFEATEALFEGGLISYSEVLDLQRAQFGAQLMMSEALQLHHSAIVQLYRALGGGWNVEEAAAPPSG
jgi:multidrug efflux system outer membrane protein